jgi:hypothetical protein
VVLHRVDIPVPRYAVRFRDVALISIEKARTWSIGSGFGLPDAVTVSEVPLPDASATRRSHSEIRGFPPPGHPRFGFVVYFKMFSVVEGIDKLDKAGAIFNRLRV